MPEPKCPLHVPPTIVGGRGFGHGRRSMQNPVHHGRRNPWSASICGLLGLVPGGGACSSGPCPRIFPQRRRRSVQRTGGGTCGPREAERAEAFFEDARAPSPSSLSDGWSVQLTRKPGGGTCSSVVGGSKMTLRRKAEPAATLPTGGGACRPFGATRRKSAPIPGF